MSAEADFLREEVENVNQTLAHVDALLGYEKRDFHQIVALGTFMHNAYSGVERILRCLLESKGIKIKTHDAWHKELLSRAHQDNLITPEQFRMFLDLLHFRHYFVHGYGHTLDEARLIEIATPAPALIREFLAEVTKSLKAE